VYYLLFIGSEEIYIIVIISGSTLRSTIVSCTSGSRELLPQITKTFDVIIPK